MDRVQHEENWRRLHEHLRGIATRRAALDAEEARCLREADAIKLWRRLGYAHINEYLERELGYSPQVGIERLRIAHALAELPRIEASLGEGRLAYSAVRELTRVATPETEQAWLDKARGKNLREIEAMVSGKKRGARPDDPSDPDLVNRVLRLELTPEVFALFRQTQSAMADEHGGRLDDSALIEVLCRRALEGSGHADRPAYQIAISVCESCGRGWQNGAGREIDVDRDVVDRARCDAELIGSLNTDQPERLRATVTPRVRRQVLARDHYRCTVPGCRSARNLDLHHIRYRSKGGGNEMWNMTTTCSMHHKCLHEGLLMIRGQAPHALEFAWRGEPVRSTMEASDGAGCTPRESVIDASQNIDAARCAPELDPAADTARRPGGLGQQAGAKSSKADARFQCEDADDGSSAAAIDDNARLALVTAGYKARQARAAVESARPHVGASATLEQVIREALRQCTRLHGAHDARLPGHA